MDVKKLYEKAQSAVVNECITISEDNSSTFSAVYNEIAEIFDAISSAMTSFNVKGAVLFYDEEKNIFSISSNMQCEICEGFIFQSISFSASSLALICNIRERQFDSEGRFFLTDCRNTFEITYGSSQVTDKIEGEMQFGLINFELEGILTADGMREYCLKESAEIKAQELLKSSFEVFSIPSFLPVDLPIKLKNIQALFEESTSEEGIEFNDSFALEIEIDYAFGIDKQFEISSPRFYFEKFGCEYSLGIQGSVKLLTFPEVDFFARYDSSGIYLLGLSEDGSTKFGFDHIAELTGVKAENEFPTELTTAGGLTLSDLTVTTDFKKIFSFMLEIDYRDKWIFCQKPELALADIKLHLCISDIDKSYGISGCLTLFGKDVSVSAEYLSTDGWIFKGIVEPYDTISLKELTKGLAQLFEINNFTLPFEVKIANLMVSVGLSGDFVFSGMILAGGGEDTNLARLLNGKCMISVKNEKNRDDLNLKVSVEGSVNICGSLFEIKYENNEKNLLTASFTAGERDELSLTALLELFGGEALAEELPECFHLSLARVTLTYDFAYPEGKKLSVLADLNIFKVNAEFVFGEKTDYTVEIGIEGKIEFADIPVAGDVLKALECNTSVSGFVFRYSKKSGFVIGCNVWGEDFSCVMIPPAGEQKNAQLLDDKEKTTSVKWIEINRNISAFQLHKLGIELKGNEIGLLVDASLNFSPLMFDLQGVGISTEFPAFQNVHFVMEGFGVSFDNDTVSVSGAFKHSDDSYAGEIGVKVEKFSLVLVGEYHKNTLMVYGVLDYPLGGPPCFSVTGLSAAFGYNTILKLPDITEVSEYPLIEAAMGKYDKKKMIFELERYVADDYGEYFLAAGIKFTSFEIVNGFAMATIAFGKETEIGLLGLADIVMPPKCDKTPLAKAQLAIKAAVVLKTGLFSCEARLTENSFILSEKCKLTGGFAFYLWFDGEHKGDFVVTLGGYHPSYHKPEHYPDVPGLGFCWDVLPVKNRLVLSGEIFFALTPSVIMAGGRLSAVYSIGNLKAYFIAYADFMIAWKPFHYDISVGITVGASYRMDVWFVHHTFTIELSAELHVWGPEFSGKAHISWFIISFTIPLGNAANEKVPLLDWAAFRESFLQEQKGKQSQDTGNESKTVESALSVRIMGENAQNAVRADELQLILETRVPVKRVSIFGKNLDLHKDDFYIQPMDGKLTGSELNVELVKNESGKKKVISIDTVDSITYGNVPSALWGEKGSGEELVYDVPVGVVITPEKYVPVLFPENGDISEEVLTEAQKLVVKDAFAFIEAPEIQDYIHIDTVKEFKESAVHARTEGAEFLRLFGFEEEITLERFCMNADNLFDDDILIGSVKG